MYDLPGVRWSWRAKQGDRGENPGRSEDNPFGNGRHSQPFRPGIERGLSDSDDPMPIRVRLDYRQQTSFLANHRQDFMNIGIQGA